MNLPEDKDIVDRAIKAMKATQGADVLPAVVLNAARRNISQRIPNRNGAQANRQPPDRVSWLTLAACAVVLVIGSWTLGFQQLLLSRATLQQTFPNGSVLTHYSDGRVVATANRSIPPNL
jgi:hypothetical protein